MFTEDLSVFLADFGVPCSANGRDFLGIFNMPGQALDLGHIGAISTEYSVLVMTADGVAANLKHGALITVNGQVFKVQTKLPEDDGAFTTYNLEK